MQPARSTARDPRAEELLGSEREELLRALHALGVPLAVDLVKDPGGKATLRLAFPREHRACAVPLIAPRLRPWAWTEERWVPPAGALDSPWVGRLAQVPSRHPDDPWRSSRTPSTPSPWNLLLPALRPRSASVWFRWNARPVGPSAASTVPRRVALPRSDGATPLPLVPPHALSREVEDRRGDRSVGPFWECGGTLVLWGTGDHPRSRAETAQLSSLVEALSGWAGGGRFTVRWVRSARSRHAAIGEALAFRPPRGGWSDRVRRPGPARLSPAELQIWLPPWVVTSNLGIGDPASPGELRVPLGFADTGDPTELPISRDEGHHVIVAGETGMGKSTLLTHVAASLSAGGAALVVIDPLGETALGLLGALSADALARSLWVSPLRSPVGLNALAIPHQLAGADAQAERERRVSELVTTLRRVRAERYGETFYWGPRIEDVLTRAFLLLSYCPDSTLRGCAELLRDPDGWTGPIPLPSEGGREAQALWEGLRQEEAEERQGALRVVQEVALSTAISRILSPEVARFSLDEALRPGAVTLFSLDRAQVGVRPSSYLGAALLSLLWTFTVARAERTKVVLVLDEVQEYANDALTEMLRLGRRYNLHVLAATQSLATLTPALRDTLVTNARDLIFFRGSPADQKLVRELLGGDSGHELCSLARGQALALLGKGSNLSLVRVPPPVPLAGGSGALARRLEARIAAARPIWGMDAPIEETPVTPGPKAPEPSGAEDGAIPSDRSRLAAQGGSRPGAHTDLANTDPREDQLLSPLLSLMVAALEAAEGEPFPVAVARVRRLCGEDEATLRRVGARLKGAGALVRTERKEGERVWFLLREPLLSLLPPPWDPPQLSRARERWERSGGPGRL